MRASSMRTANGSRRASSTSIRTWACTPSPAVKGLDDGNEATNPVTANVWAEHSIWPQDPGFETALEGGVTTLQILPGSANLIGGRSAVVKNVQAVTYQGHEVSRRRLRTEDGLRRKSQACLRRTRTRPPRPAWATSRDTARPLPMRRTISSNGTSTIANLPEYNKKKTGRRKATPRKPRTPRTGARRTRSSTAAQSAEARSEARDSGGSAEGQYSRAHALLSLR